MDTASAEEFPAGAGAGAETAAAGPTLGPPASSRVRHAGFWDEGQPVVLIADPDPCAYAQLQHVCHRQGVQLLAFPDGAEALVAFGRVSPDAVILAEDLPSVPWQAFYTVLRQHPQVPVVLGTGPCCTASTNTWKDLRVQAALPRPYRPEAVLQEFQEALDRARVAKGRAAVLQVGQVRLDVAGYEVTVGGHKVVLALREFEVLRYLMKHAGVAVSAEQIAAGVWGAIGDTITVKRVKTYIYRLRSVLGAAVTLETVRGVGYCLSAPEPHPPSAEGPAQKAIR